MGKVGQPGHEAAGRDIGGVKQQHLPRAQNGAAIIAVRQECLRLRQTMLHFEVPIDWPHKPHGRRRKQDCDAGDDPGFEPIIFAVQAQIISDQQCF